MSAETSRAVLLSYASQDAEAARRICESLRSAGVEVWFDQSEITGGDAWDRKIREQIKACALFIPVISAATQARREGYFRLEWKLAAQRTHTMADGTPFVLPVVIDATRDADALVPDEFCVVQWTRLPGGEAGTAFCARVKKLLGIALPDVGPVVDRAPRHLPGLPPSPARRHSIWLVPAIIALAAIVALAVWQPWKSNSPPPSAPVAANSSEPKLATATSLAADQKSVAVLAFANLSEDKANEYFSDGISEELLNVLGKVPGLKVTARTSAFFFKGKNLPIPEIAAKLGVAYVIEGSVQRMGDKVKIGARLTKAADGFQVWSDSFTREAKDVFAVEEEIAGLIAKQLSLKFGAGSSAATVAVKPEAFELYVQARQAWNLRTPAGYERAEALLNRTLELEPNFARAHAALADVWIVRAQDNGTIGRFGDRRSPEYQRIITKIDRALALDPEAAEAQASRALTMWFNWDFADGVRVLRQASGLNYNYATAHQWLGRLLLDEGRMDEGLAELKIATEIDPLSPRILDNYGWGLALAGRHTEALAFFDRVLALQPNSAQTLANKATELARIGRLNEAAQTLKDMPENSSFYARAIRSVVLGRTDARGEGEALLASTDRRVAQFKPLLLLALGRKPEATQALDEQTVFASLVQDWLFDPLIDPIRDEPRFAKFLATLGLTEAHARAQAWRQTHPPEKPEAKK